MGFAFVRIRTFPPLAMGVESSFTVLPAGVAPVLKWDRKASLGNPVDEANRGLAKGFAMFCATAKRERFAARREAGEGPIQGFTIAGAR